MTVTADIHLVERICDAIQLGKSFWINCHHFAHARGADIDVTANQFQQHITLGEDTGEFIAFHDKYAAVALLFHELYRSSNSSIDGYKQRRGRMEVLQGILHYPFLKLCRR